MVYDCEFGTHIYPKDIVLESVEEWEHYFEKIVINTSNKNSIILTMTSENELTYHEFVNYLVDKISISELN
jgi:hypothetical protein